jgi:hypothetical protein
MIVHSQVHLSTPDNSAARSSVYGLDGCCEEPEQPEVTVAETAFTAAVKGVQLVRQVVAERELLHVLCPMRSSIWLQTMISGVT